MFFRSFRQSVQKIRWNSVNAQIESKRAAALLGGGMKRIEVQHNKVSLR
jgi:hypothetical protein